MAEFAAREYWETALLFSLISEPLNKRLDCPNLIRVLRVVKRGLRPRLDPHPSEAVSKFAGLIAIGALSILAFHVFVNIGMTVGIAPVTGLPLPFLSYGGSSLIMSGIVVGLLLNVGLHRYEY